jgi:hypothetical protein
VQHPGTGGDPRAIRSVGIHLMTLCLFLEHGADPALGPRLHRRMVERPVFHELAPPRRRGDLTCADIPVSGTPDQVRTAALAWARTAWTAWSDHHETVREWLTTAQLIPAPGT